MSGFLRNSSALCITAIAAVVLAPSWAAGEALPAAALSAAPASPAMPPLPPLPPLPPPPGEEIAPPEYPPPDWIGDRPYQHHRHRKGWNYPECRHHGDWGYNDFQGRRDWDRPGRWHSRHGEHSRRWHGADRDYPQRWNREGWDGPPPRHREGWDGPKPRVHQGKRFKRAFGRLAQEMMAIREALKNIDARVRRCEQHLRGEFRHDRRGPRHHPPRERMKKGRRGKAKLHDLHIEKQEVMEELRNIGERMEEHIQHIEQRLQALEEELDRRP